MKYIKLFFKFFFIYPFVLVGLTYLASFRFGDNEEAAILFALALLIIHIIFSSNLLPESLRKGYFIGGDDPNSTKAMNSISNASAWLLVLAFGWGIGALLRLIDPLGMWTAYVELTIIISLSLIIFTGNRSAFLDAANKQAKKAAKAAATAAAKRKIQAEAKKEKEKKLMEAESLVEKTNSEYEEKLEKKLQNLRENYEKLKSTVISEEKELADLLTRHPRMTEILKTRSEGDSKSKVIKSIESSLDKLSST